MRDEYDFTHGKRGLPKDVSQPSKEESSETSPAYFVMYEQDEQGKWHRRIVQTSQPSDATTNEATKND